MSQNPKDVALAYIEACPRKDYAALEKLLSPTVHFVSPGNSVTGSVPYLAILKRLGAVWNGSEVQKVFVDGNDVCVLYDFVSDSPAGKIPLVEWLRVENGLITAVTLYFDRISFKPASDEIARRAAK